MLNYGWICPICGVANHPDNKVCYIACHKVETEHAALNMTPSQNEALSMKDMPLAVPIIPVVAATPAENAALPATAQFEMAKQVAQGMVNVALP